MFQICPVCDMQQDIEPYDVCQVCGHEWSIKEIRSSTPVPIERPLTPRSPDATPRPPFLDRLTGVAQVRQAVRWLIC